MAIFLLFSTCFNKSQSITTVTTRVTTAATNTVTTRVTIASVKSRIETTMVKTEPKKGGHQGNRNSSNQ